MSSALRPAMPDPLQAEWLGADGHLPAVAAQNCVPAALRARFAQSPKWVPEVRHEPPLEPGRSLVEAAVLVPLVLRDVPTVLLTERTATLSAHAGQIAFPGGRCDFGDADAVATALREAQEEIGLPPQVVEVLGVLPVYVTGTGFAVTPVVALVPPDLPWRLSPHEVSSVFEVPLAFVLDPANHHRHRQCWQGQWRQWFAMPYQQGGDPPRYIWGATAGMLRNLYRLLAA